MLLLLCGRDAPKPPGGGVVGRLRPRPPIDVAEFECMARRRRPKLPAMGFEAGAFSARGEETVVAGAESAASRVARM